jgi:hypothetical protein
MEADDRNGIECPAGRVPDMATEIIRFRRGGKPQDPGQLALGQSRSTSGGSNPWVRHPAQHAVPSAAVTAWNSSNHEPGNIDLESS